MRLGVSLHHSDAADTAVLAEQLGFDVAFAPEGYLTDGVSVLGYVAARTSRIHLSGGVWEIPARSPAMTATTAATLDALSDGRFRLGLGVANSYFSESWHGTPFAAPLARTREYIEVVRLALRREPVAYQGSHIVLPRPGDEPFRITLPATGRRIPIYLAAVGPRNLELAGAIADGWIGVFCTTDYVRYAVDRITAGRAARGEGEGGTGSDRADSDRADSSRADSDRADFDVVTMAPVVVADDPRSAAEPIRRYVARFVTLGPPEQNVYYRHLSRLGYQDRADEIVARVRAGDEAGAAAQVPFEFVDSTSLLGPAARIARRLREYAAAGVTTLAVAPFARDSAERLAALRIVAAAQPTPEERGGVDRGRPAPLPHVGAEGASTAMDAARR